MNTKTWVYRFTDLFCHCVFLPKARRHVYLLSETLTNPYMDLLEQILSYCATFQRETM
jgi:hypothetical protein